MRFSRVKPAPSSRMPFIGAAAALPRRRIVAGPIRGGAPYGTPICLTPRGVADSGQRMDRVRQPPGSGDASAPSPSEGFPPPALRMLRRAFARGERQPIVSAVQALEWMDPRLGRPPRRHCGCRACEVRHAMRPLRLARRMAPADPLVQTVPARTASRHLEFPGAAPGVSPSHPTRRPLHAAESGRSLPPGTARRIRRGRADDVGARARACAGCRFRRERRRVSASA